MLTSNRMKNARKVLIIAEAGVNHNGSLELAKKMIDAAVEAGADIVKFQTFTAENVVSKYAPKAAYQKQTTGSNETQLEMIKKLELSYDVHKELIDYCRLKKVKFLSSPFDLESIDILDKIGVDTFKIPSGEITNLPYLRKVGCLKKKIILSTGMSSMIEIENALNVLRKAGTLLKNVTILHCNTEYPTPMNDVNLRAMLTIARKFNVNVGYSDHTLGIEIPIAAVAMGATVIEKHFTLSKAMEGPDHKASLEPNELKAMIDAIRNVEIALGDGIKKPSPSELKNRPIARKSIVAAKDIPKGEVFTNTNLTIKRPGTGINPMKWDEVIGKKAGKDYIMDEIIEL